MVGSAVSWSWLAGQLRPCCSWSSLSSPATGTAPPSTPPPSPSTRGPRYWWPTFGAFLQVGTEPLDLNVIQRVGNQENFYRRYYIGITVRLFCSGTGKGCFSDIDKLTMFADYRFVCMIMLPEI